MSSLSKRKWKIFFSQKKTYVGLSLFLVIFLLSCGAHFISNDKPLLLIMSEEPSSSFLKKKIFFPVFFDYSPQEFGITDTFVINYQELSLNQNKFFTVFPINPWSPEEQSAHMLLPPSTEHWLGTDYLGRDIFARLLYGTRISLGFAIFLWLISYTIGFTLGALQAYFMGPFDFILERIKELVAIIPILTLVILVTAMTQNQSFFMILFLVLLFSWIGISNQIRANVFSIKKQEYCQASFALGGSSLHILTKHILPNTLTPLLTLSPFAIEGGISLLAALDYLGFGLAPPTPSIGELIAQGRDHMESAPWLLIAPVATILVLLISVSFVGQALRKAFNPRNLN
jgi:microcin C transport system permease protein